MFWFAAASIRQHCFNALAFCLSHDPCVFVTWAGRFRFSDDGGRVSFDGDAGAYRYRIRAQGYVDAYLETLPESLVMQPMTSEQYIASYPSNVWLSQLSFGGDELPIDQFRNVVWPTSQSVSPGQSGGAYSNPDDRAR